VEELLDVLAHLRVLKKEPVVALLKERKELRSALVYVVTKNRRVQTYIYKDTNVGGRLSQACVFSLLAQPDLVCA